MSTWKTIVARAVLRAALIVKLPVVPHNLVRDGRLAEGSPGRGGGIEDR
jgi:hypothetical protein